MPEFYEIINLIFLFSQNNQLNGVSIAILVGTVYCNGAKNSSSLDYYFFRSMEKELNSSKEKENDIAEKLTFENSSHVLSVSTPRDKIFCFLDLHPALLANSLCPG